MEKRGIEHGRSTSGGFHKAEFDSEAVRIRLPYIERIVEEAKRVASSEE